MFSCLWGGMGSGQESADPNDLYIEISRSSAVKAERFHSLSARKSAKDVVRDATQHPPSEAGINQRIYFVGLDSPLRRHSTPLSLAVLPLNF